MMRIAFFEESAAAGFGPIALTRPAFELICGQFSLRERLIRLLNVTEWGVFIRPPLAEVYREGHPEARVNDRAWLREEPTFLINGRWIPAAESFPLLEADSAGLIDGQVAWLQLRPNEEVLLLEEDWEGSLATIARSRRPQNAGGILAEHPWDLINRNGRQLEIDFGLRRYPPQVHPPEPQVVIQGRRDDVYVDPAATVDPFVVLDARAGPICVEAGAHLQPFTRLEGPCHVGRDSQLFRAHVRGGTTIGPVCRVGGEVEASILHGYVNKYHDGFLGHSYVCPWVNLGALTTNSDLKNDYSEVRIPLTGEMLETGQTKVGCFIGDHVKTALGSLFNTGSSIGVLSMVLPEGGLLPKHVPPFSCFLHGELSEQIGLERALETARTAMQRRNCELTAAQERLLRFLYEETRTEREGAIRGFRERQERRMPSASAAHPV